VGWLPKSCEFPQRPWSRGALRELAGDLPDKAMNAAGSIKGDVKRKHSSLSAGREWIFDIQPLGCGCHGNLMELGWRGGGLNGCCFIPAV